MKDRSDSLHIGSTMSDKPSRRMISEDCQQYYYLGTHRESCTRNEREASLSTAQIK